MLDSYGLLYGKKSSMIVDQWRDCLQARGQHFNHVHNNSCRSAEKVGWRAEGERSGEGASCKQSTCTAAVLKYAKSGQTEKYGQKFVGIQFGLDLPDMARWWIC